MSKSLKKLIDINRLREFKNKLVGTGSAYVQTGAVDQTVAGTKTFSKPIAGSVTGSSGSCTGNAATATRADSAANADTATNATNATNSNAANQLQAFVNDNFTGGNHYVKAIRSSQGWSTHLWMCYNNGAKMADEVSVNYATNSGYANWLRTSSHTDHLFHTEWDGSYFWTYVTAGDGGYRAVRVERSNSSGYADSAGSATKLATARTIALSGAATGTATGFDGSGNITIPVTALAASAIRAHILSMVYPVGSVYISVNDVSPETFLGGTWEKISQGRVLQGASGTQTAGTEVSAGLPNISVSSNGEHTHTRGSMNITGNIVMHGAGSCTPIHDLFGAFYRFSTESSYQAPNCASGASSIDYVNFSADRAWTGSTSSDGAHSHNAYITGITGNSTTVQPPALLVNIWKRTA